VFDVGDKVLEVDESELDQKFGEADPEVVGDLTGLFGVGEVVGLAAARDAPAPVAVPLVAAEPASCAQLLDGDLAGQGRFQPQLEIPSDGGAACHVPNSMTDSACRSTSGQSGKIYPRSD